MTLETELPSEVKDCSKASFPQSAFCKLWGGWGWFVIGHQETIMASLVCLISQTRTLKDLHVWRENAG